MDEKNHTLTAEQINRYRAFLHEQERAEATIQKYLRDLHALEEYLGGKQLTKLKMCIRDRITTSARRQIAGRSSE